MRRFIKKHADLLKNIFFIFVFYLIALFFYAFSDILIFNKPTLLISDELKTQSIATNNLTSYKEKTFNNIKVTIPTSNYNSIAYILSDNLNVSYLSNYLANHGYLCFTFSPSNINEIEHIINRSITSLSHPTIEFGDQLLNKGDKNSVSLISIGAVGDFLFKTTLDELNHPEIGISSALLIAPMINLDIKNQNEVPYIPIGVVLPEFDGIVRSLDGQSIYNNYLIHYDILEPISTLYLFGANHNFFYDVASYDDALNIDMLTNKSDDIEEILRLDQKAQQNFIKKYTLEFLNFYNFSDTFVNIGLNPSHIAPNTIFNQKVLTSLLTPDSFPILSPTHLTSKNHNNIGGAIKMSNASISQIRESYIKPHDSATAFLHPGLFVDLGLINLSWNVDIGNFTTFIPQSFKDFSEFTALSIWIATNPSSSLNAKTKQQSFIITVQDLFGRQEHILIDSNNALRIPNGKEVLTKYQQQWSTFTPLSNIRIPLDLFNKIDISKVVSISFNFNQTQSGSIYIGDIRLIK